MKITADVTKGGDRFSVEYNPDNERVDVFQSDIWVGDGVWHNGRITDCPAVLGDTIEDSEFIYACLDEALADAILEVS